MDQKNGVTIAKHQLNGISETIANLPKREHRICEILTRVNQLRQFQHDVIEIMVWKDSLVRINPDLDLAALEMAVDGMLDGRIDYDGHKGILNIFKALKRVAIDDDGKYYILKQVY